MVSYVSLGSYFGLSDCTGYGAPHPIVAEGSGSGRAVDHLFAEERKVFRARVEREPALAPFRFLSDSLLTFLCGEKNRLALHPETRLANNLKGEAVDGFQLSYTCEEDGYHPKQWIPFDLMGYWLPEEEGKLFVTGDALASPLVRNGAAGREVLFLIHPKSALLFAPLMQHYRAAQVSVPALALSSFRTLLIAIAPTPQSLPQYAMVKVSLHEQIAGVPRILSENECASSVGFSQIVRNRGSDMGFMAEPLSFVPDRKWMNAACAEEISRGAGMIYRPIPTEYMGEDPPGSRYVLPLFALFGLSNRPLLDALILQSKSTPTAFIENWIVRPLAKHLVDLIYKRSVSIEAHGQNLLMAIDTEDSDHLKIGFIYRDMGGVNALLSKEDLASLPANMQQGEYFYQENHQKDVANALELYVVQKMFFNLTKQFFKSDKYDTADSPFAIWKSQMIREGFAGNWTTLVQDSAVDPDAHEAALHKENYRRYGYFEELFGIALLEEIREIGVFETLGCPERFEALKDNLKNPWDDSVNYNWFNKLIYETYLPYRQVVSSSLLSKPTSKTSSVAAPLLGNSSAMRLSSTEPSEAIRSVTTPAEEALQPHPSSITVGVACLEAPIQAITRIVLAIFRFLFHMYAFCYERLHICLPALW